jgi:hypothetical protein
MPNSCALLPHGAITLIPAVLAAIAWLCSFFQSSCDYVRLSESPAVTDLALNDDVPWLEVGFSGYREPVLNTATNQWEIVYDGPCYYYPYTVPQDGWWKFAKTMDFMAVVIGGAGSMFIWMASCCTFSKATWRVAGYEILLASIFQASSFTWLKNSLCQQGTCTLFWGSKADIVASVLWFVASIYIIAFYPQPKERDETEYLWTKQRLCRRWKSQIL